MFLFSCVVDEREENKTICVIKLRIKCLFTFRVLYSFTIYFYLVKSKSFSKIEQNIEKNYLIKQRKFVTLSTEDSCQTLMSVSTIPYFCLCG
jgi:hypothetical protein